MWKIFSKNSNNSLSPKTEKSLIYILFAGITFSFGAYVFSYFYFGKTFPDLPPEIKITVAFGLPIVGFFYYTAFKVYQSTRLDRISKMFALWAIYLVTLWGMSFLLAVGLITQIAAVYFFFSKDKQREESP